MEQWSAADTPGVVGTPTTPRPVTHSAGRQPSRWPRSARDQRGDVVQTVLVAPTVLLTLMLIIQFALMFHARNIAEQAAQEGAASARAFDGSAGQAKSDAEAYLASLSTTALQDRAVLVQRTQTSASVTVTGTSISLVPGVTLHVKATAAGPVERYVPPTRAEDR